MTLRFFRTPMSTPLLPEAPLVEKPSAHHRQARNRAAQAHRARRTKQAIAGAGFLALLGAGWLYPVIGYFIPLCMVLGIGVAAFRGRSWCNWLCPRGSFEDAYLAPISRGRRIPRAFRTTPLRVGVMAFLMSMLTWQIVRLWPDPLAIGGFFVLMLSITTAVGLVLGLIFHQRTWCYVCPIGTMSNWVGKNRQPLLIAPERCTDCNLCAKKCPMQLSPGSLKEGPLMPNHGDCLKCSLCVESCPKSALAFAGDRGKAAAA
jgi:ferredoxin-type protein NapH